MNNENFSFENIFCRFRHLSHFDRKEHLIPSPYSNVATIPRLGWAWKIIFDFEPTEYLKGCTEDAPVGLWVVLCETPCPFVDCSVNFPLPNMMLEYGRVLASVNPALVSDQLPGIGEWTRIEITFQSDKENWVSFSIGGNELGRVRVPFQGELFYVSINVGSPDISRPGLIRRLIILEKLGLF